MQTADIHILDGKTVEQILNEVADFVIPGSFPVWNGETPLGIKKAILHQYYFREIGLETVPLWKDRMLQRLTTIMPYYVKLWNAETSMGSIFENHDFTERGDLNFINEKTGESQENGHASGQNSGRSATERGDKSLYSDTPQNGLQAVENGNYLTSATIESGNSSTDTSQDITNNSTLDRGYSDTEKELRNQSKITTGYDGDKTETWLKFRDARINILEMIFANVNDLFMTTWG